MPYQDPREWEPGESRTGIDWAPIMNQETENVQALKERLLDRKAIFRDYDSITGARALQGIGRLNLADVESDTVMLTVVGVFPAGAILSYRLDTGEREDFLTVPSDGPHSLARQVMIPAPGQTRVVAVRVAMPVGSVATLVQIDLREVG